jgi:hypothetical protein
LKIRLAADALGTLVTLALKHIAARVFSIRGEDGLHG